MQYAPASDHRTLPQAQVVFWLIGATDGHAKNFSIFLHPGGGYAMTPLYDVLTAQPSLDTRQIERKQMKLAMRTDAPAGGPLQSRAPVTYPAACGEGTRHRAAINHPGNPFWKNPMRIPTRVPPRRRLLRTLGLPSRAALGGLLLFAGAAAGHPWALHNGTVAGGGGQDAAGGWELVATYGEAVMGTTAQDGWMLVAGFPATLAARTPAGERLLFRDSFESDSEGEPTP